MMMKIKWKGGGGEDEEEEEESERVETLYLNCDWLIIYKVRLSLDKMIRMGNENAPVNLVSYYQYDFVSH